MSQYGTTPLGATLDLINEIRLRERDKGVKPASITIPRPTFKLVREYISNFANLDPSDVAGFEIMGVEVFPERDKRYKVKPDLSLA